MKRLCLACIFTHERRRSCHGARRGPRKRLRFASSAGARPLLLFLIVAAFGFNASIKAFSFSEFMSSARDLSNNLPALAKSDLVSTAHFVHQEAPRINQMGAFLSNDQSITGRIRAIDATYAVLGNARDATVDAIQNGRSIQSDETDSSGMVRFDDLAEGEYGYLATSPSGFAAFAIFAVDSTLAGGRPLNPDVEHPAIDVALVPKRDRVAAQGFIAMNFQPERSDTDKSIQQDEIPFADRMNRHFSDPVLTEDEFKSGDSRLLDLIRGDVFYLGTDGTVSGQFAGVDKPSGEPEPRIVARSNMRVAFIRHGVVVDTAIANEMGEFKTTKRLLPGYYSFVAARADAFISIGCRVSVPDPDVIAETSRRKRHIQLTGKIDKVDKVITKMVINPLSGTNATFVFNELIPESAETTRSSSSTTLRSVPAGTFGGFAGGALGGAGGARFGNGGAGILGAGVLGGAIGTAAGLSSLSASVSGTIASP